MICQEPLSSIDNFDVINENVHGSKSPPLLQISNYKK